LHLCENLRPVRPGRSRRRTPYRSMERAQADFTARSAQAFEKRGEKICSIVCECGPGSWAVDGLSTANYQRLCPGWTPPRNPSQAGMAQTDAASQRDDCKVRRRFGGEIVPAVAGLRRASHCGRMARILSGNARRHVTATRARPFRSTAEPAFGAQMRVARCSIWRCAWWPPVAYESLFDVRRLRFGPSQQLGCRILKVRRRRRAFQGRIPRPCEAQHELESWIHLA